jgi:hypothetical protein
LAYRDVVIFIPGIGGSTLRKDGRLLWGMTWEAAASALFGNSLEKLTIQAESPEEDLEDGIIAAEVCDGVQVIPGLWKTSGYGDFCNIICETVGLKEGSNFFRFPYDWRRDNRVSARALARFAHFRLNAWRESSGAHDARLVIVAHSMGGLVARSFIEHLEGWKTLRRLVTLGTPHRGSLNALGYLMNGFAKGIGPFSIDATAPLRSFASVYQLLPTYPCVKVDDRLERITNAKLTNVDMDKVADAAGFHATLSAAAETNSVLAGYPQHYLTAMLSAGQPTFQSASLNESRLDLLRSIDDADNGGDGTVPMVSAIPPGMAASDGMYVDGIHSALTSAPAVRDHVVGSIKAEEVDMDKFRSRSAKPRISMSLEDAYEAASEFEIEASVHGISEQKLVVQAISMDGQKLGTTLFPANGIYRGPITLPAGAWRISVSGAVVYPVEDVILVATSNRAATGTGLV